MSVEEVPVERPFIGEMHEYGVRASNVPAEVVVAAKSPPSRKVSVGAMLLAQRKAKVERSRERFVGERPHVVLLLLSWW